MKKKTTSRFNKTLSTDISAFQKSFSIDELKKAIDVAESKYYLQ